MKIHVLLIIFTFIFFRPLFAKEIPFRPWNSKIVKVEKKPQYKYSQMPSTASWTLNRFVRFFQIYISPQDGPNCRYIPTCAKYAQICINKYGPFLGIIMFADRYMRCNPAGAWGMDTPEDNYFWHKKNKK